MADLQITDEFGLSTTLQLSDDSPLAKAKITQLTSLKQDIKDEITKPIDQTSLKSFSFGLTGTAPTTAIGSDTKITLGGSESGGISIARPADKTLFPKDNFSPDVDIASSECWMGVELDVAFNAGVQASADGFGVGIKDGDKLALTTYKLITATGGKFPDLLDGLKTALESFYLASSAAAIRAQPPGTVCVHDLGGTVTLSGSYQLPVSINPLASVDLPFNYKISVQPTTTVKLSGSIGLMGDWIVRLHKITDTALDIGIYKKKGTTLTASFTAGAGIGIDEGTTDLASLILSAVFPGADSKKAGLTGDNATELNAALKDCIDRSLSISANLSCSAQFTDEAAVVYHLDLSTGSTGDTNAALTDVLRGDWTKLTKLPNAQRLRNITTDTTQYKHEIAINLFSLYNAVDEDTYVQSCTILCDPLGNVSVTDKVKASRISAADAPYLADPDKLRTALAQDFLATASYAVVASRVQQNLAIQQSYLRYARSLSAQQMKDEILTGIALHLINDKAYWDATLVAIGAFPHACITASAKYGNASVLSIFFSNPGKLQPRSRPQIEKTGRDAMIALIDAGDQSAAQRLTALRSDTIWNEMDSKGAAGTFNQIPELSRFSQIDLGNIAADWTAIRWWADSMLQVAPKLADLLTQLASIPAADYSTNPGFLAETKEFQKLLGGFVQNTHAAFADGWGMAVVFALAGSGSARTMDIVWTGNTKHYESNS
jgi:hypothetical protein